MLKTSLRLFKEGWAIHLLRPKSKMPLQAKWTSGPRASWPELLKTYKPGMNLGVRLGKASKLSQGYYLAVIDCDVKSVEKHHLKEMNQKLVEFGIPVYTKVVLSGRGNGSKHFYVKTKTPAVPKRLAQSNEKVKVHIPSVPPTRNDKASLTLEEISQGFRLRAAWEISLMGEGQQCVIPPSIHPDSGAAYKWTDESSLIAEFNLPDSTNSVGEKKTVLQDFKAVPVDLYTSTLSDHIIADIVEGDKVEDGSASLFAAAIAMRKAGYSEQQILSALTDTDNFLGEVAYRHANTKSRKRAAQWVLNFTLKKAGKVAESRDDFEVVENVEEAPVDEKAAASTLVEVLGDEEKDWRTKLERDHNGGKPKSNFKNIKLTLKGVMNDKTFLSFNEFSLRITWLVNTPWKCKKGEEFNGKNDCIKIKDYLIHNFRIDAAVERITEVVIQIAQENSFHPVREYIESLEWDGVSRLDNWLVEYLGAYGAPKEYLQAVGRKVITAMIARVIRPGCEFAYVMVLEGKQRIGKSAAAKILGGEWYADTAVDLKKPDAMQTLQGVWVYELAELAQFGWSSTNHLKGFISSSTDRLRVPYGTHQVNFPRQSIFIGTTNDQNYLRDKTGNSRFWPVKFGNEKLNRERFIADRDQLLAEAKFVFEMGENIWMDTPELERLAEVQQTARMEIDELEGALDQWAVENEKNEFTIFDVMNSGADWLIGINGRGGERRIGDCLRSLGFLRQRKRVDGVLKWVWKRALKNDSNSLGTY